MANYIVDNYNKAKEILSSLKVVNDTSERGVKLIEEYNNKFSKNKNQNNLCYKYKIMV